MKAGFARWPRRYEVIAPYQRRAGIDTVRLTADRLTDDEATRLHRILDNQNRR